jgi:Galactose oxidase, central domain
MNFSRTVPMLAVTVFAVTVFAVTVFALTASIATGTEHISSASNMNLARAGHTATLLPDGKVLVAAGCIVDGCEDRLTRTVEVFDPSKNTFSNTGQLAVARVGHAAILLDSGKVLIVGGWAGSGATASAELYDPTTNVFAMTGNMNEARDGFTATRLTDGRVLIVGGYRGNMQRLSSAELYDPRQGTFAVIGHMGTARMSHSASLLPDGRVLIVGGTRTRGEVLSSAEIFDPMTGIFQTASGLRSPRHKQAAVTLNDGRIMVLGGADANEFNGQFSSTETFNPKSGQFVSSAEMKAARFKISDAVTQLVNGDVLIAGSDRTVEIFDPIKNTFRAISGQLDAERSFSTVTRLPDDRVLIAGGYDPNIRVTNRTWLYNPR